MATKLMELYTSIVIDIAKEKPRLYLLQMAAFGALIVNCKLENTPYIRNKISKMYFQRIAFNEIYFTLQIYQSSEIETAGLYLWYEVAFWIFRFYKHLDNGDYKYKKLKVTKKKGQETSKQRAKRFKKKVSEQEISENNEGGGEKVELKYDFQVGNEESQDEKGKKTDEIKRIAN